MTPTQPLHLATSQPHWSLCCCCYSYAYMYSSYHHITMQDNSYVPTAVCITNQRHVCRQVGIPAVVLERDAGLRLEGSAIALWSNAFRALAAVGVAQPLLDDHPPLRRREF